MKTGYLVSPRAAHLFSMLTNGLSLKPRDRLLPGRLTHRGRASRAEIFCGLVWCQEDLFRGVFRARWTCAKSGAYAFCRITSGSIFGRNSVADSSHGACGFIKPRLRTVSPLLKSSSGLELAYSRVRDGLPMSFLHSSCVERVKEQCCPVEN